ncbi:PREDICTED: putative proline-rich protein 21 [Galeopterus variegatus]|uniref:Proline-rich protein 21 n=1 Tax=Galeopterus variegatus TaxID=482537 RepID=A0ABM0Q1U3_GALVR|nr:PREDICTED: putative proline-rich protein 21 [Galeopterus variegatus]
MGRAPHNSIHGASPPQNYTHGPRPTQLHLRAQPPPNCTHGPSPTNYTHEPGLAPTQEHAWYQDPTPHSYTPQPNHRNCTHGPSPTQLHPRAIQLYLHPQAQNPLAQPSPKCNQGSSTCQSSPRDQPPPSYTPQPNHRNCTHGPSPTQLHPRAIQLYLHPQAQNPLAQPSLKCNQGSSTCQSSPRDQPPPSSRSPAPSALKLGSRLPLSMAP